mgnify:CR=1 FL=1
MRAYNYFVYITTNPAKTVLYVGVTNNLFIRIKQHQENAGKNKTFAGRYFCFNLIFWERYSSIHHAIAREKEIKKWRRRKKIELINEFNPDWGFLNDEI